MKYRGNQNKITPEKTPYENRTIRKNETLKKEKRNLVKKNRLKEQIKI